MSFLSRFFRHSLLEGLFMTVSRRLNKKQMSINGVTKKANRYNRRFKFQVHDLFLYILSQEEEWLPHLA
jgi:hypothetical protein